MIESAYNWPQCGICQFEVAPGDDAIDKRWKENHAKSKGSINNLARDPSPGVSSKKLTGSFHQQCLDIVALQCPRHLDGLAGAMKYSYQPHSRQNSARRRRIQSCLGEELLSYYGRLPLELWNIVAEDLLSYYASAIARSLWTPATAESSHINITEKIWCKYVDLHGTSYIKSLSNTPSGDGWKLIFEPSCETTKYIFLGEDHLGITKLLFASSSNLPAVDQALEIWWRTIYINAGDQIICGKSDGIKLRQLLYGDQAITTWSIPQPNKVRFKYFAFGSTNQVPARMSLLVCNHISIIGYSILWSGSMITIHSHQGINDTTIYQSSSYGSWLYMPIDHNEVITEIWQRRGLTSRERALGIKTNMGRVFVAGIYSKRLYNPTSWTLVDRPHEKGRIFFEDSEREITALAFESDDPMGPNLPFPLSQPSENTVYVTTEDFFYSNHDLTTLVKVTPCKIGDSLGFTGMLLHFSNGHCESMGQVRLDCLCSSISLEYSTSWYLAFNKMDGKYPYIAAITTTRCNPDLGYEAILDLTCDGRLECFWSHQQCYVTYKNQKSPRCY